MSAFIPPRSDAMFKRIFADPNNPAPLRSFLSSVLTVPADDLENLTLVDTHLGKTRIGDKESVVDVRVRTTSGRDIDVEIQLLHHTGFRQRLTYYAATMLASHLRAGDQYTALTQAICIAITDFTLFSSDDLYRHRFRLQDEASRLTLADVLEITTLELPKLHQTCDQTLLWNWLSFLSSRNPKEMDMIATTSPDIAEAATKVHFFNEEENEQILRWQYEKAERDRIWIEEDYKAKGKAQGLAEGLAEGRVEGHAEGHAEGLAEGHAEGRVEGLAESTREIAKRMIAKGIAYDEIAELTRLPIDTVKNLAEQ